MKRLRYDYPGKFIEDPSGDYVEFSDVEVLLAELNLLRSQVAAESGPADSGWVSVEERLPADETPVLILRNQEVRIGELRWEHPGFEDTYKAFRYWDDPLNDGQCWEWPEITHWMPLPKSLATGDTDK